MYKIIVYQNGTTLFTTGNRPVMDYNQTLRLNKLFSEVFTPEDGYSTKVFRDESPKDVTNYFVK